MKALLIVDVQNDFLPRGPLGVPEGDRIIPLINQLQSYFNLVVASQDWHPREHISFASTHHKAVGEKVHIGDQLQILWPDHCVQETQGSAFPPSLRTEKIVQVFHKGTNPSIDGYSAFFDNALHIRSTGLDTFLRERGVTALFVAGLATDYCVLWTVLDGLELDFEVFVVTDACEGMDPQKTQEALEEMEAKGAHLITTQDLIPQPL